MKQMTEIKSYLYIIFQCIFLHYYKINEKLYEESIL